MAPRRRHPSYPNKILQALQAEPVNISITRSISVSLSGSNVKPLRCHSSSLQISTYDTVSPHPAQHDKSHIRTYPVFLSTSISSLLSAVPVSPSLSLKFGRYCADPPIDLATFA